MLLAQTKLMVHKRVFATLASTVTDTSALLTLAPSAHAKQIQPALTKVIRTSVLATLVSTSDTLLMKDLAKDQLGMIQMPAMSIFAPLPTHATLTPPALTMLMVLRLVFAMLVSTAMVLSASSTPVL
jgi:hypothetical protein